MKCNTVTQENTALLAYIHQSYSMYQRLHGHTPNLLSINKTHLEMLLQLNADRLLFDELIKQHGLRVLLNTSCLHPSLSFASGVTHYNP